ncbi:MAG TPA: SDR family NAD(P)-dependent oxidoreductase [Gemmatimonadales bacterium]|nr:SDR family NAD(P)-dependent oxidoreductase [Gemmatimonadales bacterium]
MPTALVTGATEGIGRAIAFALGRAGHTVGVCARTPAKLEALLRDLAAEGITAAGLPCDVGDPVQVAALVAHVTERLGPVEVLVNNAGIGVLKPFAELSLAEWDGVMATNLRGVYLVTSAVLPGMRARRRGDVINISSLAGKRGFAGGTAYSASKHALMGFSESLNLEVRKDGVRVVAVCPGSVDTKIIHAQTLFERDPDKILKPEDVAAMVLAVLQLPRRATVTEFEIRPADPS